jgi:hypothetical protein
MGLRMRLTSYVTGSSLVACHFVQTDKVLVRYYLLYSEQRASQLFVMMLTEIVFVH